jgi:Glycosyltransferase family 87
VRALRNPLALAGAAGIAVLIGLAGWTELNHAASLSTGSDMDAYWNAAMRLRAGQPLYVPGFPTDSDLYRYAPWFAYVWVPFTFLPKGAVLFGWMVLCLGAAIASAAPLLWRGPAGWATIGLILPFQLEGAAFGNVQPLLVLALLWGLERRSGPLWLGIAASLKGAPILLAMVYAGRGEWRRAAAAMAFTAILVLPMFLFDLRGYSTRIGGGQMSLLTVSPIIWMAAILVAVVATWAVARTRYAWVAGSAAMMLALPRFINYEIGFALVGLASARGRSHLVPS